MLYVSCFGLYYNWLTARKKINIINRCHCLSYYTNNFFINYGLISPKFCKFVN